eukprot:m.465460 g.465460  ORF g.465460 m.465460 type:complete len:188 (+) comp24251_c0_seq1:95-658(+)
MKRDFVKQSVAILATHGFEENELTAPAEALAHVGIETVIVSSALNRIQAQKDIQPTKWFDVEQALSSAHNQNFDALLIPGGRMSIDALCQDPAALSFVRSFINSDKPVFTMGYGPQLLIAADVVRGRSVTGHKSIQNDLANAGAHVDDFMLVADGSLLTCRCSEKLVRFSDQMIEMIFAHAQAFVAA